MINWIGKCTSMVIYNTFCINQHCIQNCPFLYDYHVRNVLVLRCYSNQCLSWPAIWHALSRFKPKWKLLVVVEGKKLRPSIKNYRRCTPKSMFHDLQQESHLSVMQRLRTRYLYSKQGLCFFFNCGKRGSIPRILDMLIRWNGQSAQKTAKTHKYASWKTCRNYFEKLNEAVIKNHRIFMWLQQHL